MSTPPPTLFLIAALILGGCSQDEPHKNSPEMRKFLREGQNEYYEAYNRGLEDGKNYASTHPSKATFELMGYAYERGVNNGTIAMSTAILKLMKEGQYPPSVTLLVSDVIDLRKQAVEDAKILEKTK